MTTTREAWLGHGVQLLRNKLFQPLGFKIPEELRISVGFPKGGRGLIGQCWSPAASGDGKAEIFVHPIIEDPVKVLDIVTHEVVHAINHRNGDSGHGKAFKDIAVTVGLEGKMTATTAGPELVKTLARFATLMGPYPHKALTPGEGAKKQGTRLLKGLCPGCGYTIRLTAKWADLGLPTCVCGEEMSLESDGE